MSSIARNRDYYEAPSPGRDDYWRYMAAPRLRVARIVELLRRIRPSSIVDLGCGNGALLGEIRAAWPEVRRNTERPPSSAVSRHDLVGGLLWAIARRRGGATSACRQRG